MEFQAIMVAVPWLRRVWKLLPPPLRIPLLLVVAAVGVWYAVTGRKELADQQAAASPQHPGPASPEHPGPADGGAGG